MQMRVRWGFEGGCYCWLLNTWTGTVGAFCRCSYPPHRLDKFTSWLNGRSLLTTGMGRAAQLRDTIPASDLQDCPRQRVFIFARQSHYYSSTCTPAGHVPVPVNDTWQKYLAHSALCAIHDSHGRCSNRLGIPVRTAIWTAESDPGLAAHSTTELAWFCQRGHALARHLECLANAWLLCGDGCCGPHRDSPGVLRGSIY